MLIVTILIAAVVSAFAGGMGKTSDKAPQMTLSGSYSINKGMELSHTGGEPLSINDIQIVVNPGKGYGIGTQSNAITVNKSTISNSAGKYWVKEGGTGVGLDTFAPGDTAYIEPPYHSCGYLQHYGSSGYYIYCFNATQNIGKYVSVKITTNKGQLIAQTEFPITG